MFIIVYHTVLLAVLISASCLLHCHYFSDCCVSGLCTFQLDMGCHIRSNHWNHSYRPVPYLPIYDLATAFCREFHGEVAPCHIMAYYAKSISRTKNGRTPVTPGPVIARVPWSFSLTRNWSRTSASAISRHPTMRSCSMNKVSSLGIHPGSTSCQWCWPDSNGVWTRKWWWNQDCHSIVHNHIQSIYITISTITITIYHNLRPKGRERKLSMWKCEG